MRLYIGDWVIESLVSNNKPLSIFKASEEAISNLKIGIFDSKWHKIIATTDKELALSDIPESFLLEYCRAHNKNLPITEVMVEYESELSAYYKNGIGGANLPKLTNNAISISKVKDSWDKGKLMVMLISFRLDYEQFKKNCHYGPNEKEINEWNKEWIEKNL